MIAPTLTTLRMGTLTVLALTLGFANGTVAGAPAAANRSLIPQPILSGRSPTRPPVGYARVVFTADGVSIGGHAVPWGGQVNLTDADAVQFFPGDGYCRYDYGGQAIVNQGTVTSGEITLQNSNDNNPPSGVMLLGLAPGQVYRVPYGGQWGFKPGDHVLNFSVSAANAGTVALVDKRSIRIHVAGPCQPRFTPVPFPHTRLP